MLKSCCRVLRICVTCLFKSKFAIDNVMGTDPDTCLYICALPYCFTTFSGYKTISLIGLVIIYTLLGAYSIILMKQKTDKR